MAWARAGWPLAIVVAVAGCGAKASVEPATVEIASPPPASASITASASSSASPAPALTKEQAESLLAKLKNAAAARNKNAECNALIGPINATVDALQKPHGPKRGAADPTADLRAMAKVMDDAVRAIDATNPTIPELVAGKADYRAMVVEVAAAARAMAAAATTKDVAAIRAAQERMERAVANEDPIVERINAFCQS
jgi:hypothetical protein